MPFTEDGIRPDIIINPHAIPSRMTIGQIIESLFGKVCTSYGAYGDCTAFQVKGSNYSTYAPLLVKAGFHSSGNQILYNGMNGEQLGADIYIGPTYYMRLKHMVKDKINYRARGPNTVLTRQPVQGRANDGGLRIGEMERDGVLAHGMSYFLNESFMVRGEKQDYYIAICNKSGAISIYNESKNLFLSPYADGPIKFNMNSDGTQSIMNLTRFGRSFSILRIPYAFKLLMQELLTMNVQMRIITDDNVDQLLSMSYSDNINKLMKSDKNATDIIKDINLYINKKLQERVKDDIVVDTPEIPEPVNVESQQESPPYAPDSTPQQYNQEQQQYNQESPPYAPDSTPQQYNQEQQQYNQEQQQYNQEQQQYNQEQQQYNQEQQETPNESSENMSQEIKKSHSNILEVQPEASKEIDENSIDNTSETEERKIIINIPKESPDISNETKKITL
jgi:DNA-directed RNA polymerase II subunit RPB2